LTEARPRGLLLPAILTLVALAILVSLGNWQVRRLAWKENLIERVSVRPSLPPVDFINQSVDIGSPESFLDEYEYRRAVLGGEYIPSGEVLAFTSLDAPRGKFGGPGYWVMTPFRTPSSGVLVYVNRGFVPAEAKADYAPPPEGQAKIEGLIRAPELGSRFTPDPDVENRIFYARDIGRIAAATGSSRPAAFFVDLVASETPASGLPQAGETRMTFTNNHLEYAVTWYGLAAALLAVFAAFAWRSLRERGEKPA
jgi:surfeit locus 1 family protein